MLKSQEENNSLQSKRCQRSLSTSSETKLKIEYKSRIRRCADTYKRAVYYYLCGYSGDNDSLSEVLDNVDDFLWFKLSAVTFCVDETQQAQIANDENLTFSKFQALLSIEYGEKHFIGNNRFFVLFAFFHSFDFNFVVKLNTKKK